MSSHSVSNQTSVATVVTDAVLIVGYIVSALRPDHRVWPIGESRWRWWFNWSALSVVFSAFPVLGYLDRDSFRFTGTRSTAIGTFLSVVEMGFSLLGPL